MHGAAIVWGCEQRVHNALRNVCLVWNGTLTELQNLLFKDYFGVEKTIIECKL